MMNLEKRALFTIISLLTLFSLGTFAQSKKESIKPSESKQKVEEVKGFSTKYSQTFKILWTAPSTNNSEGISQSFLNFDGVSLSGTEGMPYYSAKAKLPSGYKNGKVSLINLAFEELSASELAIASKYNKIANGRMFSLKSNCKSINLMRSEIVQNEGKLAYLSPISINE